MGVAHNKKILLLAGVLRHIERRHIPCREIERERNFLIRTRMTRRSRLNPL